MRIAVLGIDLAKSIFHLYGVDELGRRVLSKRVSRAKLGAMIANLPPCVIGMEACSTSHHWARRFQAFGHEVRLIHPNFVRPYVKGNKNDELDAEAICEASSRPNMRFVPVKTVEQQDVQALHRARERLVRWRTALINQIRGIMGERGIVVAQGARRVGPGLQDAIADHTNELTGLSRGLLATLADELAGLEARLHELDHQLVALCRQSELCRRVSSVPGIGPVIATALVASIGDGRQFKNGRELAAWIGLVPRQRSSGGKIRLVGIGKRAMNPSVPPRRHRGAKPEPDGRQWLPANLWLAFMRACAARGIRQTFHKKGDNPKETPTSSASSGPSRRSWRAAAQGLSPAAFLRCSIADLPTTTPPFISIRAQPGTERRMRSRAEHLGHATPLRQLAN